MNNEYSELLNRQDIEVLTDNEKENLVDVDTLDYEVLDVAFSYGEHRTSPEIV